MVTQTHDLIIDHVAFGSPAMEEFLRLPWIVQASDPCWVAPTLSHQRKMMDPARGFFFENGEAQYFLARRNGQPVGRISAHINRLHDERYNDNTGFFGFFECVDDQSVANALFEAASGWLRERGRTRLRGPLSFSIYDEIGLLVEGFDTLPALMQVHNPPYYERLVEDWGFRKAIDWYALKIDKPPRDIEAMKRKLKEIMDKHELRLTAPKPSDVMTRKWEVFDIFNDSWSGNWGHVPFTRNQFENILKELRPVLRTDLTRVILTPDDKIAGFIFTIPDLNPTLQKMNGKLSLWGMLRLYYESHFTPLNKIRTVLLGVRRDYQQKMLHHALILATYIDLTYSTIKFCDCSLIPETLGLYLRTLYSYGAERYKTWRIYDRDI
jgi:hypothetical protein